MNNLVLIIVAVFLVALNGTYTVVVLGLVHLKRALYWNPELAASAGDSTCTQISEVVIFLALSSLT